MALSAPLKTSGIHTRQAFGILLGFLLSVAGTGGYRSSLAAPIEGTQNTAEFEQLLGFPSLFRDTGQGTAVLAELKMPIPESALAAITPPLALSSVERGFFNLQGTHLGHHRRDDRGNTYSVVQSAPLTQVQLHVPGSENRLEITQTGREANTALHLSGDHNRVNILQAGPNTKIEMKVKADATDLSVQQTSKGATFILSGQIAEKGTLSVRQ